ncbi:hypothetical protein SDC9_179721 [bioreactor metagenome]|uniref:Uncharacterized protein n=1 Tax=bioreactor metagenome TaxID=1076179 RepID=A0A645GZL0_9ZZZZ
MSLEFTLSIVSEGTPSTTIKASLLPMVVTPRTRMVDVEPGAPEDLVTVTPAIAP